MIKKMLNWWFWGSQWPRSCLLAMQWWRWIRSIIDHIWFIDIVAHIRCALFTSLNILPMGSSDGDDDDDDEEFDDAGEVTLAGGERGGVWAAGGWGGRGGAGGAGGGGGGGEAKSLRQRRPKQTFRWSSSCFKNVAFLPHPPQNTSDFINLSQRTSICYDFYRGGKHL